MKKNLFVLLALTVIGFGLLTVNLSVVHAADGTVGPGGACTADTDCQDANGQSYGCNAGICTVNGDTAADGTVKPGGACTNDNSCADVNGTSYGCFNGVCTVNGDASTKTTTTSQTNTTGAATTQSTNGSNFVALTNLPNIQTLANSGNLPGFFNQLYKICIGVAAAIALFKIIQAGVMYMGGDSVTETKQARAMIVNAIGGLVLVLSPAIVFGIVNPNILSLKINTSSLAPQSLGSTAPSTSTTLPDGTAATCTNTIANGSTVNSTNDQACCAKQTGCKVTLSIPAGGTILSNGAATCTCTGT